MTYSCIVIPKIDKEHQDSWCSILDRSQDTTGAYLESSFLESPNAMLIDRIICDSAGMHTYEPHKSQEQNHDYYYKGCLMCSEISVYVQRTYGHHKHCFGSISNIQNLQLPVIKKFFIHLRSTSLNPTKCTFSFFPDKRGKRKGQTILLKPKILSLNTSWYLWALDFGLKFGQIGVLNHFNLQT